MDQHAWYSSSPPLPRARHAGARVRHLPAADLPSLLLGRALIWTVTYDHFFVEHARGHHARVATEDDPATSRFGETYAEL